MGMTVTHREGLRFSALARGHEVISDQPSGKGGTDQGMTPPELLMASLGACIGVYVVEFAERHHLPHQGLTVDLDWERAEDPTRIARVKVQVRLPGEVSEDFRKALHRVAEQCLIHNTLRSGPEVTITITS